MTWQQIHRFLSTETDKLAPFAKALRASNQFPIELLFQKEPDERNAVDEACRQFAAKGNWPQLNQTQALLAYIRLGHAAHFSKFLAFAGDDESIFPQVLEGSHKASILEFLLIEYWEFAGNSRWRTT